MVTRTPRPHFTPGKDPVPILQEAGWAPGPVWTGGKSRPHRDSIADRPARSQSLYRLSYPAHVTNISLVIFVSIYLKLAWYNVIVPGEIKKKNCDESQFRKSGVWAPKRSSFATCCLKKKTLVLCVCIVFLLMGSVYRIER